MSEIKWDVEPGPIEQEHQEPTPLAWCRCGRSAYWCRCADPRPDTLRHQRVPCGDAFCATCWEAGER